jgi:hypothetical protein
LQNSITQEAEAGVRASADLIRANVGGPQADEFMQLMTGGAQSVQGFGEQIAALNAQMANSSARINSLQYGNNLRLINRALADARGLAGLAGGSRLGGLQREQWMLGRQSQALGLESQDLSLQMNQRQINFQKAIAGFQAPGITGQERAARMAEAEAEAEYAQKQQDIGVKQFGIAGQQFGVEGQIFNEQNRMSIQDLEAQRSILIQTHEVEQQQLAAQKEMAALAIRQGQVSAKAQGILNEATSNYGASLSAAAAYTAQFGGGIFAALTAIRRGIDILTGAAANTQGAKSQGGKDDQYVGQKAAGWDAGVLGATSFTAGEAAGEHVVVLRNPRHGTIAPTGGSGGGGTNIQVVITGNSITADTNLDELAAKVAREVEDRLGQKASMLGVRAA